MVRCDPQTLRCSTKFYSSFGGCRLPCRTGARGISLSIFAIRERDIRRSPQSLNAQWVAIVGRLWSLGLVARTLVLNPSQPPWLQYYSNPGFKPFPALHVNPPTFQYMYYYRNLHLLHVVCLYHAEESERIRCIPMYMYRQDVYLDDIHTFLLVHVGFRAAPQTYSFSRCCTDRWTLFT